MVREGTYSATSLCTEINTVFVSAVQARTDENKDSPRIAAATASGPLIASISLEPSYEIDGQYRAEIELTNFVTPGNLPAGASMFGQFDAVGVSTLTVTQNTAFTNLLGTLAYSQWPGTGGGHVLRTVRVLEMLRTSLLRTSSCWVTAYFPAAYFGSTENQLISVLKILIRSSFSRAAILRFSQSP